MSESSSRPRLRVVMTHGEEAERTETPKGRPFTRQQILFSDASSFTLGFIKAGELDAARLTRLIEESRPRLILDLRPVPSFARGAVQRRAIFALFNKHDVEYFDVAGVLGVSTGRDGLLNPALLIDAIQVNILRTNKGLIGPIFFFVDDELFNDDYFTAIAARLPHQDGRGWDIACWPNDPGVDEKVSRRLVFVSHANPEDNEVADWFCSRLAAQGYQVWSDTTRLIGGEVIWDTIEDAIRRHAAKVIVLLSKRGHQKPGVLDEVNVAIAAERVEGLDRFVIPIRIDELAFTSVRANLARKNIIDGSNNLADALRSLLKVLIEDGVPRATSLTVATDWTEREPDAINDRQWDVLFENKIDILRWPQTVRKFRSSISSFDLPFVSHPIEGGLVTCENWGKIAQSFAGQVQKLGESTLSVDEWPASNSLVFSSRSEMHKSLSSLIRQGWDKHCASLEMLSYPLANGAVCWFLKNGALAGNRVRYKDQFGFERTKVLVGHSPKRAVYWHFGVEARISVADRSLRLVPHVVFSEDGVKPISSVDRQHALRRGFCRSWWNARWRDLLVALLAYMSRGGERIRLPVSDDDFVEVAARLHVFEASIESMVERYAPDSSQAQLLRFAEPLVAVGYGQKSDYPKEGLLQFGPVPFDRNPSTIRAGVVGTPDGIELFQRWSDQFNTFRKEPSKSRHSISFPGFEAVFGAKWNRRPVRTVALSRTDVINTILLQDRHQAVYRTSGLFVDAIAEALRSDDLNVDIWYVIIPDEIYLYGRPASRVPKAIAIATPGVLGKHAARRFTEDAPSLFAEDNAESIIYDHHLDFHHQLKARLLHLRAVTQVLRESSLATVTSTLVENPMLPTSRDAEAAEEELDDPGADSYDEPISGDEYEGNATYPDEASLDAVIDRSITSASPRRQMQDAASFAWNIGTTTFFKAGGRPWRVASARQGVCYVGLIFKREASQTSRHACCGAQMFLDDSDGLVFKGAMGPWYSPETGQFHLSRREASRLLRSVVEAYVQENKTTPKEIFIHGRTRFDVDEWQGFCDAVDLNVSKLTAVRITRSNEYKLYSSGELAVKRGTALRLTSWLGLLWTSGYISKLETYPGRETPNPLRIEIVRDSSNVSNIDRVMTDIMMLTKMNFNSCVYSDGLPVTMRFAEAIGDVLITAKDRDIPPLPFRYYI